VPTDPNRVPNNVLKKTLLRYTIDRFFSTPHIQKSDIGFTMQIFSAFPKPLYILFHKHVPVI